MSDCRCSIEDLAATGFDKHMSYCPVAMQDRIAALESLQKGNANVINTQDMEISRLRALAKTARHHYDSLKYPNVRDYALEAAFEAAGYPPPEEKSHE